MQVKLCQSVPFGFIGRLGLFFFDGLGLRLLLKFWVLLNFGLERYWLTFDLCTNPAANKKCSFSIKYVGSNFNDLSIELLRETWSALNLCNDFLACSYEVSLLL